VVLTGMATALPVLPPGVALHAWAACCKPQTMHGTASSTPTSLAILYTSGSTGRPKGVVLSHRNMVAGAKSVASYLGNRPTTLLLAALPLSFDAGFSQLTTAFHVGRNGWCC
jgi:long-subunit acyl-CoA synthetase (AMP-forming)